MLIYVKKKKYFFTDRQSDGQPKTIVRNLTTSEKSWEVKKKEKKVMNNLLVI